MAAAQTTRELRVILGLVQQWLYCLVHSSGLIRRLSSIRLA